MNRRRHVEATGPCYRGGVRGREGVGRAMQLARVSFRPKGGVAAEIVGDTAHMRRVVSRAIGIGADLPLRRTVPTIRRNIESALQN